MDNHILACDHLISRAESKGVIIPFVPGTDVQVIRLDASEFGGQYIPPTRIFFRMAADGKAHMLNIEPIPMAEYDDEDDGEQLEMEFDEE